MARSWLIDGRTIASKVKNPTPSTDYQIKDYGAKRECPNCQYFIDNSDVCHDWPGLPAGVKFDPSDAELVQHLAAKCGVGDSKPHAFIDDFIPTLSEDGGICYTHPEKLPGVKKDGTSVHFFHRTINAYATGQRKRRKVYKEDGSNEEQVRWHKTGRTKFVIDNGVHKGCKKIMVLYKSSKKGYKPDKSNWVMHQYHLGRDEDEKEGQYVVSKIFYQQQKHIDAIGDESLDVLAFQSSPRTPNPNPPNPPRPWKSDVADDNILQSPFEEKKVIVGAATDRLEDDMWLPGESQAADNGVDDSLLCNEILNYSSAILNGTDCKIGESSNNAAEYGIEDLETLDPYSQLPDLQISSQDSIFSWIDRMWK
ncbi:SUPPRESSOR OF GAMMA RESPONSE 1-like [Euphorbia lathyris]|uniref:SUPPRESSOR OF GAMMA RESPONSE 1-like n=1 Tax=Euphorbia lathyris TaxID=212925 RepID=UPI003313C915